MQDHPRHNASDLKPAALVAFEGEKVANGGFWFDAK
jgi:hypothetical protein